MSGTETTRDRSEPLMKEQQGCSARLYLCRLSQLERRHKYNSPPRPIDLASVPEPARPHVSSSTEEGQDECSRRAVRGPSKSQSNPSEQVTHDSRWGPSYPDYPSQENT